MSECGPTFWDQIARTMSSKSNNLPVARQWDSESFGEQKCGIMVMFQVDEQNFKNESGKDIERRQRSMAHRLQAIVRPQLIDSWANINTPPFPRGFPLQTWSESAQYRADGPACRYCGHYGVPEGPINVRIGRCWHWMRTVPARLGAPESRERFGHGFGLRIQVRARASNGGAGGEREQPARVIQEDIMHGQSAEMGRFRAGEVELKGRYGLIYAAIIPKNESAESMGGAGEISISDSKRH
ncbi:hypothetical protein B0H14DRAFT_2654558 [Mycena olivaceomarginata]|nr:hypothetical protein B0H14DRAFT_2654558 [Mycena olivaceomarginata]